VAAAARPVIVAGGGVSLSGAEAEVLQLAERLSIPVATSLNGKGSIPEEHPLNLGIAGTYACGCTNRLLQEADLVLFIGSNTGDQVTNNWTAPALTVPTIQLNIEPGELGRNYPAAVGLAGDARETLRQLLSLLPARAGRTPWAAESAERVRKSRAEWLPLLASTAVPIRTERLCHEITARLPEDAILVSDTGHAAIWTGSLIRLTRPGQRYLRAAGSLGWALPAALGAKCAAPDRPVLCFIGDGGFWYHFAELETALRYGIRTVTVINNNQCFSQCSPNLKFYDVNFARVAREMGCLGIRVDRPEELAGALQEALAARVPAVIDVVTDPACRPPAA
jgi:acetolactate synthase-1/2/3 large subunit